MTKTGKSLARSAAELVGIIAVALGLALGIQAFVVKPYEIPSRSMVPTLQVGQRILVDRIGMHFSHPAVGEVYVFHPPVSETCADPRQGQNGDGRGGGQACDVAHTAEASQNYVKRVVGLPAIRNGHVYRDGRREHDPYAVPCQGLGACDYPVTITVPRGDYYMMGDNRPDSLDSRYWGPVPRSWLIGEAFFTYWPPHRIGIL